MKFLLATTTIQTIVKMKGNKYFILFLLLFPICISAKEIPAKSSQLVNDYAGVLTASERSTLEQKLTIYSDTTSTQIAIVIERTLDGDDLFDYCQRLAEGWGIGVKGKNNGILIYVAIDDRKSRVHTGYGMEATITDALSSRIRTNIMNPAFKEGRFYDGLDAATTAIIKAASGEFTADPNENDKIPTSFIIFIIILIVIVLLSKGGGGRNRTRGNFGGPLFWGGTFGSGGFSGGSSGGGFGGFGGGSFGGGGSGGSW